MVVPLTPREVELLISWKEKAFWPDEERVLRKLRQALAEGRAPDLSRLQIRIAYGWAEERMGGHYGGGEVRNPEERAIADKLRAALEGA